jgi:cytochrome P450/ferredoxin-NADP reductase
MTTSPVRSYEEFDHHSPEARDDLAGYYAAFRGKCPVGRSSKHENGFVYLTRYADVFHVTRNDALFSSTRAATGTNNTAIVIPGGPVFENFQFPMEQDPPDQVEYRRLLDLVLSPAEIDALRPMIRGHATRIVNGFIEQGGADLVREFTNPLPTAVTLDWLGFPDEDWERIGPPVHDLFTSAPGSERQMKAVEGFIYMEKRIVELVRDRRVAPRDDAISRLTRERKADGSEFSDADLLSVIGIAIAGGVDTTTSFTGSVLVYLDEHPEMRQALINAPDLLVDGTDELLRMFGSVTTLARTAAVDTEVGGCPIRKGERILLPWFAANHDPSIFPEPEEVRLDRDASRHLSFGTGVHRCPGAHLARAMFQEMMTQVLTRLPEYTVQRDSLVGYPSRGIHMGWDVIPARFPPGPRLDASSVQSRVGASNRIGDAFDVVVDAVETVADDVIVVTLCAAAGGGLPHWEPGAHLELRLPSGRLRQYSLCSDPADLGSYDIAVLRETDGRGGSAEMHEIATPGLTLTARGPRNHFPLIQAEDFLLLAGGIGITPIIAMLRSALAAGRRAHLIYGGRQSSSMAFRAELEQLPAAHRTLLPQDEQGIPDFRTAIQEAGVETAIYCCGPPAMIAAVQGICDDLGARKRLHLERFTADVNADAMYSVADNTPFEVELARTGTVLQVPADKRLIEVVRDSLPGITYDCEKGFCGSCETRVLAGVPEHRDLVLTEEEKDAGQTMMICVGRACSERLVLDL